MLISHDLGTTGDKASLHEDDGHLIAATTASYATRYGPGGVAEQEPGDWWGAVCASTRTLLDRTSTAPESIVGVGLSGQMMGVVLLDEHRDALGPSIIWADTRSTEQCDRLVERFGMAEAYSVLGHRLNPTYSLTKLMWLSDHDADRLAAANTFCLAKDYVASRLTGVVVTDPSDASGTNAFDQTASRWSDDLIAAAGVRRELFPEIVPAVSVLGGVTNEAAAQCGLCAGTPVVLGGGDGPMAAVGAGVVDAADGAYAYLGSSSWISIVADTPLLDLPAMRTMTFDDVVTGRYVPTATMQSGAGSVQWLAELLGGGRDAGGVDRLVDRAAACPPGEDLYFLPYLLGERSPYWNPRARGAFIGLARSHGAPELTRAVLEGVGYNLLTCLQAFRQHAGPIERIDAIGGGAASDVWLQLLADIWGCVVRRRTVVEEANSLGAAVTAAVGLGNVADFSAARDLSTVEASFEPDPERHAAHARRHARFVDAYERLAPWFAAATR